MHKKNRVNKIYLTKKIYNDWVIILALIIACRSTMCAQTINGRIVGFDFSNTNGTLISRPSQSNNATYVDSSLLKKSGTLSNPQNSTVNGNFIINNYFVSSG